MIHLLKRFLNIHCRRFLIIRYVIPARDGSKGLPHKNRILFDHTFLQIPEEVLKNVYISTDDSEIIERAAGASTLSRAPELSNDTASMLDVLIDVANFFEFKDNDIIVLLYLTYPGRQWATVQNTIRYFEDTGAHSMLGRKPVKTHPYLCVLENGRQVIKHDLYRRQDYPVCYEISHAICMMRVGELEKLNRNLYNENTVYVDVDDYVDIDTERDYAEEFDK